LSAQTNSIRPGESWLDNRGQQIQAHGGGILLFNGTYYWFGEDRTATNDPAKVYVSCYSSKDLARWTFQRQVFVASSMDGVSTGLILQRPKVYYNPHTHKFVMYMHMDGPGPDLPGQVMRRYALARVAVAVSDTVDGDYRFVRSFRPLDEESRDIGQFVDDDGKAYLIFESRPTKGFFIASLSDDYLDVKQKVAFIPKSLEGGALIHYGNLYYVIGSHLSGWRPNPNVYATAPSLAGPWTTFKDIAPADTNTYNSQSTFLLKVVGTKSTTVIFMADQWHPDSLWDSRYLWMPLSIQDGTLTLPPPYPWTINVITGVTQFMH